MKNEKLQDLSRQYWEAIARQDYEWSDYIDCCLEREGVARLPREDCDPRPFSSRSKLTK